MGIIYFNILFSFVAAVGVMLILVVFVSKYRQRKLLRQINDRISDTHREIDLANEYLSRLKEMCMDEGEAKKLLLAGALIQNLKSDLSLFVIFLDPDTYVSALSESQTLLERATDLKSSLTKRHADELTRLTMSTTNPNHSNFHIG